MKKTIKLAVVAALALGATSAFATNGSVMLGVGAKTRGMGGAAIGVGHGAESSHANPALITSIEGNNEISFGGTVFMPDLEVSNQVNLGPAGDLTTAGDSDADMFVIPSVSLASKINDNWYWGLGMWGTGGLGVDYRTDATGGLMNMVTALQLMQFGVPIAYTSNGFSVGVTPIIQYGSLDINYVMNTTLQNGMNGGNIGMPINVGAGVSDDLAFGFNVGMAYETSGFTIGAVYKSEITMEFEDVLNNAMSPFTQGVYNNDELSSPEEYGVGISYAMAGHTLAVDWKRINWEDAETYKDFGWEDQDVIAVGYQYANDTWALRCGYQYAESAVQEQASSFTGTNPVTGAPMDITFDSNGLNGSTKNTMNLLGFPGTQEEHITIGGSYKINETLSMDLAAVFALENTETFTNFVGQQISTDHSEDSYSIQINYNF